MRLKMFLPIRIVFLLTVVMFLPWKGALCSDKLFLSIPIQITLQKDERISEFKIKITAGHVFALTKIPRAWLIKIKDGSHPYITEVEGIASHGVAFISGQELLEGIFKNFMIIEKDDFIEKEGISFNIECYLKFESTVDDSERHVKVEKEDLIIEKYKEGKAMEEERGRP